VRTTFARRLRPKVSRAVAAVRYHDAVVAQAAIDTSSASETREIPVASGTAVLFSVACPGSQAPNEDTAAVIDLHPRRGLLIVADGLGGRPGGEIASRIAVTTLEEHARAVPDAKDSLRSAVLEAVDDANRRIMALGIGAGTTLAVVEVNGQSIRGYHVGDSEILAFGQRGRIKYQTVSHSPTAYAVESGFLDEAQALHHADRHLVSNVIGDAGMRIEMGSWLRLARRDTVVVGTDGLFDNLRPREIASYAGTGVLKDAAERLAHACLRRMTHPTGEHPSKPDDLTFILYRPAGPANADLKLAFHAARDSTSVLPAT
jgi:serine/threonine protein phosphatase PrpC